MFILKNKNIYKVNESQMDILNEIYNHEMKAGKNNKDLDKIISNLKVL